MRLTNTLRVTIVAIVAIVALCLTALATPANAQYPDTLAAPDLVLIGVTSAATAALAGERVAVGADVLNVGTAPAVASRLKYYFSADATFDAGDKYLNYDKVSALSPGQSSAEVANVRIPYGTVDGAWFVLLVADDWSEVAEADETNNVAALAITVGELLPPTPAMPDLVVAHATLAQGPVAPGETVASTALVENIGEADAETSHLKYFLSADTLHDAADKQLSYDTVAALTPGALGAEDANLRIKLATDPGSWYVLFVADAANVIAESDETNNVVAMPLTVVADAPDAGLADLVIQDGALAATTVPAGEQVALSLSVYNVGQLAAEPSRLRYYLSNDASYDAGDDYLNYDAVPALEPGAFSAEGANLRIPSNTPDGPWYLLAIADIAKVVTENYESNNVAVFELTVGPADDSGTTGSVDPEAADIMVFNAALDRSQVQVGEKVTLTLDVQNVGIAAAPDSRVKYYLSRNETYESGVDKYLGYDNVPTLLLGETSAEGTSPTIPATIAHGTWYVLCVADANEQVVEADETNNVVAVPFEALVDAPDAVASDLTAQLDVLSLETCVGCTADFQVTVSNAGIVVAEASRFKVYLSADNLIDAGDTYLTYRDVGRLPVGDATTLPVHLQVPFGTADGEYQLLVSLDSERAVVEQFESNNVLPLPLSLGSKHGLPTAYPYACPDLVNTDAALLQHDTIATFNVLHLGWANQKNMAALACVVSHFDVVGLVEVDSEEGLQSLAIELFVTTGESWSYHISEYAVGNENGVEFYAYIWRTAAAEMTGTLGFYDDPTDTIKREPYGANFRMGNFDFTLVVFHQRYGNNIAQRRVEGLQLLDIYTYFQDLNGLEEDVLIGGDFNLPGNDAAFTLVGEDSVTYLTDPEQKTTIGADGLSASYDNMFFPASALVERRQSGALDFTHNNHSLVREVVSDHLPVWMAVDTSVDDD